MNVLRTGIVGGGFMGRTHTAAARAAGAEVVGVVSSSPERTADASAELGVPAAQSVAALAEAADVVHICSPNGLHAEHVRTVLEAGAHVVCEKPLALDGAEAQDLAELAQRAGVVAAVPFIYRFHPMARQARSYAADGNLGRLLTVRGSYLQDWMLSPEAGNWRVDPESGGRSRAFGDIGSHLVDLVEFVAGERVRRLSAKTAIVHPERGGREVFTEDAAAVIVEMDSGAVGTLTVSQVNAGRKNALTLELAGTESSLTFDQEHPDELWLGGAESSRVISRDAPELSADAHRLSTVPAGHPMGYLDAFAAFVRDTYAVIGGASLEGFPDFNDGARANQIIDAVLASAADGTWIDVERRTS